MKGNERSEPWGDLRRLEEKEQNRTRNDSSLFFAKKSWPSTRRYIEEHRLYQDLVLFYSFFRQLLHHSVAFDFARKQTSRLFISSFCLDFLTVVRRLLFSSKKSVRKFRRKWDKMRKCVYVSTLRLCQRNWCTARRLMKEATIGNVKHESEMRSCFQIIS